MKCQGADRGILDSQDACCDVPQPRAYTFNDTGECFVCDTVGGNIILNYTSI